MVQSGLQSHATRRWVLIVAVAASASFLVGLLLPGAFGIEFSLFKTRPEVVTYDRAAADDGYVSVAVLNDQRLDLVAKDGRVVHSWHLPYPLAGMAQVDADGSLLYLGKLEKWIPPNVVTVPGNPGGVLQRLDWDGNVVWTFDADDVIHHDFTELPDGTIAVWREAPLPAAMAAHVTGGVSGSEFKGEVWADQIVEIDPATGEEQLVFDIAKAWRPEDHPLPPYLDRSQWTHANSIEYTSSDPLSHQEAYLISFRSVSTILLVARKTGEIIWSYGGPGVLHEQHDPSLLPNGHVLVFDNGQYRSIDISASHVLEIDPLTNQVVWSYEGYGVRGSSVYSPVTGGAQRLPNGDTLVTLGTKGQLLEVTGDGKIVWDYRVSWGPADPNYEGLHLSFLFKSRSYAADDVAQLR